MVNDAAVKLAVRAGLAVGCTVNNNSIFSRKHYFYPDNPKGYQISQFDRPICTDGAIHVPCEQGVQRFEIERIHMEEDAGKLIHDGDRSLVDWNRGGTPLIEIVGRPDLHSAEDAEAANASSSTEPVPLTQQVSGTSPDPNAAMELRDASVKDIKQFIRRKEGMLRV